MLTVSDIAVLRTVLDGWRRDGERIALVPTMGNLHAGHVSLVERGRAVGERIVVSLFVNPMQFDQAEDLAAYPRTFEEDRRKLQQLGVDLLFAPGLETVYPRPLAEMTRVEVPGLSDILEGAARPGHFAGVATVVTKLFNLVRPEAAVFGEKDYQQLLIIRRLVADLDFHIDIIAASTVREMDGLAMSSRNGHLSEEERRSAPELYAALQKIVEAVQQGERDYPHLEGQAFQQLTTRGFVPDYVSVRRSRDLAEPRPDETDLRVLAAARLGSTRLIDNLEITARK